MFIWILEGEGKDKRAVSINLDHVIRVVAEGDDLVVFMSDGKSHVHSQDNREQFQVLLNRFSARTLG